MQRDGWYSRHITLHYILDRKAIAIRSGYVLRNGIKIIREAREKLQFSDFFLTNVRIFPVRFQLSTEDVMKLFVCFCLEGISELPETWEGVNN